MDTHFWCPWGGFLAAGRPVCTGRGGVGLAAVAGALPCQLNEGKQNRLTMCGHTVFVAAHGKPSNLTASILFGNS
ncbi:hypothetical protein SOV_28150 [Sporomusa ovata DSM 2662]|uniref:Uncharacterized protein n=1 Tax=Sporomusa ovata TaxID=2378 RepID=A0A0U1L4S5_9FIRM|nr:hypothetical protein SOV_4c07980 [Sporomusa ovata DSM 2662]CQR74702.1 hypothetical protein SpAn4DRAFT_1164 [Sporomusa ovata]